MIAERRVQALPEPLTAPRPSRVFEALKDYAAERRMRAEIAAMPDGTFSFSGFPDDDGISTNAIEIRATLEISGDADDGRRPRLRRQVVGRDHRRLR